MNYQEHRIEQIALAFYAAEQENSDWDTESEVVKAEFRIYAREALILVVEAQLETEELDDALSGAYTDAA